MIKKYSIFQDSLRLSDIFLTIFNKQGLFLLVL